MIFGENEAAVAEVFELATTQHVLAQRSMVAGAQVESDFAVACRMAWEDVYGAQGYSWTDIREREMSSIKAASYQLDGIESIRSELLSAQATQLAYLKNNLAGKHIPILDDVFADLSSCAFKRAVLGKRPGFFEDVFQIYRSGGWPCGWSGDYPDNGRLIAYFA